MVIDDVMDGGCIFDDKDIKHRQDESHESRWNEDTLLTQL
jgi:hypothetical protein